MLCMFEFFERSSKTLENKGGIIRIVRYSKGQDTSVKVCSEKGRKRLLSSSVHDVKSREVYDPVR